MVPDVSWQLQDDDKVEEEQEEKDEEEEVGEEDAPYASING